MKKIKENLLTIGWSLRLALSINAKIFLLWSTLSILLAVLPAVALYFNRETVFVLSNFLLTRHGEFRDVLPSVVSLGVVMTAMGVSKRINGNFLYFIMYDSYYFGLEEHMMDVVRKIEIKTLMDKKYRDDHWSAMGRCGALADFMSSGCLFLSKLAGAISLLVVAAQTSWVIFAFSAAYIVAILILNFLTADKLRWDGRPYSEASRLANYYQGSAMSPGVAKEMRVYDLAKETIENWDKAYDKEALTSTANNMTIRPAVQLYKGLACSFKIFTYFMLHSEKMSDLVI